MLLAEIHGKHNQVIESDEDYLTSTVLGHLRFVKDGFFWKKIFQKAVSSSGSTTTNLIAELEAAGAYIEDPCNVDMFFWPRSPRYGEPDVLLHFRSKSTKSIVIILEIKLHSEKSSVGSDDQLCRYFELLHDRSALSALLGCDLYEAEVGLVYLTERFSAAEVLESIRCSKRSDAGRRMFPLQWQDITEVLRSMNLSSSPILSEVFHFLVHRQYDHFQGFQDITECVWMNAGHFYGITYFSNIEASLEEFNEITGDFYV